MGRGALSPLEGEMAAKRPEGGTSMSETHSSVLRVAPARLRGETGARSAPEGGM